MDFGPRNDDDEEGNAKSLYFDGNPPPGYRRPDDIEWKRPEDFCSERPQFIDDGAIANDVR